MRNERPCVGVLPRIHRPLTYQGHIVAARSAESLVILLLLSSDIISSIEYHCSQVNENYWDLTFQTILWVLPGLTQSLYRNGRAELQGSPVIGFSTNRLSDMAWGMSTPIRVGIPTDSESGGASNSPGDGRSAVDTPCEPTRAAVAAIREKPC
ncbi:hypothetical protein LXA43DRAFT_423051 [Ganoderma leucocontextum]|nr:hypothetical protein LXA43DRAFT_423051 [Ganoderma leucocontextum]